MLVQNHAVQSGGNVDRHVDVDLLACVKLRAKQIEAELRMETAFFREMIMPAMMAFREQRDGMLAAVKPRERKLHYALLDHLAVRLAHPVLPVRVDVELASRGDVGERRGHVADLDLENT